jgi:hypothetical protein
MPNLLNTVVTPLLGNGGIIGAALAYKNQSQVNGFDDTSSAIIAAIVIIVLIALAFCILGSIATYRLTDSAAQVILYLVLGNLYLFFAWIVYGMTGYRLVKISRGL